MNGPSIVVVLVACGLIAGCDSVGFKGTSRESQTIEGATTWPFVPVAMRVHPFTSIARDPVTGSHMLEARVELLDRLGDVTKGVGDFRFELYTAPEKASQQGSERRVAYWDVPMTSLDANARHWDPITRTYVLKLRLEELPTPEQHLKLHAQFTDPGGKRLVAETPMQYRPEE
jgi:hypothetical protein